MVRRLLLASDISKQSTISDCAQYGSILLHYFLIIFRPFHSAARINLVLLTLAVALLHGAAWGQDFPDAVGKLIDKQKTGEKQEKTKDGKSKIGLKDPVCNNERCNALWSQIRDALELWYVHKKATVSSTSADINSLKTTLGVDHNAFGDIQSKKAKLKKSDPEKFGDAEKIEKYLKELTDKYSQCQKPCPGEEVKDKRQEHCIIVLQYDENEKGVAAAMANNTAVNEDFMGGAQALAAKLELDPSKIKVVGPKDDLISAIAGYAKDGVCCKSLAIFGHGTPVSGALMVPGGMKDGPSGTANNTLGGNVEMTHNSATRKEYAKKKLDELKAAIQKSCADPKLTVTFYSCFVGETNGLAKQLAELGVNSEGYSGSCTFPKDKDTGEYLLPGGKDGAEIKKFPAIGGGGGEFKKPGKVRRREPGYPFGEQISHVLTATDAETWCEYGDGVAIETEIVETDQYGTPVEFVEDTTTTAGQIATRLESNATVSKDAAEGQQQVDRAKSSEDGPELSGVPADTRSEGQTPDAPKNEPETPKTPPELSEPLEGPPPESPKTEEVPEEPASTIPDTIFVKAKELVLEGQPPGSPIENQVVKLFPGEEPELPGTGETREAQDTGFDKDPVQCMTGADGDCEMQIPPEDRAEYDLPDTGELPAHYRVDYDLPKDSGGVAETTGKTAELDVKTKTSDGTDVTTEKFSIGDRTFVRLVYEHAYGLDHDFDQQFKPVFGESYEEDYCRDKQPGPLFGMQPPAFSALNRDLPEATLRFDAGLPAQGAVP